MTLFRGLRMCLDIDYPGERAELMKMILHNGGEIVYFVTINTDLLVSKKLTIGSGLYFSTLAESASKLNIPIVSAEFITSCIANDVLLKHEDYEQQYLSQDEINLRVVLSDGGSPGFKEIYRRENRYESDHEGADIPSPNAHIMPIRENYSENRLYTVLRYEIMVSKLEYKCFEIQGKCSSLVYDEFRVVGSEGNPRDLFEENRSSALMYQYQCSSDPSLAAHVFSSLFRDAQQRKEMVRMEILAPSVGTAELRRSQNLVGDTSGKLNKIFGKSLRELFPSLFAGPMEVMRLIGRIFEEAQHQLLHTLGGRKVNSKGIETAFGTLSMSQLEKCESQLILISNEIAFGSGRGNFDKKMGDLLAAFPVLAKKPLKTQEDCEYYRQMITFMKDSIDLGEIAAASNSSGAENDDMGLIVKYKSLRCNIILEYPAKKASRFNTEYDQIEDELLHSAELDDSGYRVGAIYALECISEIDGFESLRHSKFSGSSRLLYHGTSASNVVGILSHGLVKPQFVVSRMEGTRSDEGLLGCGIYFADDIQRALQFASPAYPPSSEGEKEMGNGRKYIFICEVLLGTVFKCKTSHNFEEPPTGFQSVCGVPKHVNSGINQETSFKYTEYVIFEKSQQRLRYLIELLPKAAAKSEKSLSKPKKAVKNPKLSVETPLHVDTGIADEFLDFNTSYETQSTETAPDTEAVEEEGLYSQLLLSDGQECLLQSSQIKVKILDITSKVTILQEYVNPSNDYVEGRYYFGVESNAAISGFEAYVNGKHVVGIVKEKDVAKKEYNEALDRGDGAYLMEQKRPDLFSVSLGNLPPKSRAIIVISYISEIEISSSANSFRLKPLNSSGISDTVFGLEVSIDMPYRILGIQNVSAPPKSGNVYRDISRMDMDIKQSETKATVRILSAPMYENDLVLRIEMEDEAIHTPRLWIEEATDEEGGTSYAAMLVLYPQLSEAGNSEMGGSSGAVDFIFMLDQSASMREEPENFRDAVCAIRMCLSYLRNACGSHSTEMKGKDVEYNILSFGSSPSYLFPCAVPIMDEASFVASEQFLQSAQPDRGSTSLYSAIRSAYSGILSARPTTTSSSMVQNANLTTTNVVVCTDGHIHDMDDTLSLISRNTRRNSKRGQVRLHVVSVGNSSATYNAKVLARVGNGKFLNISEHESAKERKREIRELVDAGMKGALTDLDILWQTSNGKEPDMVSPRTLPPLYDGERLILYAYLDYCLQAKIYGRSAISSEDSNIESASYTYEHVVYCPSTSVIRNSNLVHQLAARAIVRDFNDGIYVSNPVEATGGRELYEKELIRKQIENLGVKHQILTQFTSFVAIEDRSDDQEGKVARTQPTLFEVAETCAVDELVGLPYEISKSDAATIAIPEKDGDAIRLANELSDNVEDYVNAVRCLEVVARRGGKLTMFDIQNYWVYLRASFRKYRPVIYGDDDDKARLPSLVLECLEDFDKAIDFVESAILPQIGSKTSYASESVVACTLLGDMHRLKTMSLARDSTELRDMHIHRAQEYYEKAIQVGKSELHTTDQLYLGAVIQYSNLLVDWQDDASAACELLKEAFDEAICELDTLDEDSYKDSTLLMQLMKDNLTILTEEGDQPDDTGIESATEVLHIGDDEKEESGKSGYPVDDGWTNAKKTTSTSETPLNAIRDPFGESAMENMSKETGVESIVNAPVTTREEAKYKEVFVKTLTGKTIILGSNKNMDIASMKKMMLDKEGIPPSQQRFVCNGKQVDDDFIPQKDSIVHLVLRLRGSEGSNRPRGASEENLDVESGRLISAEAILDQDEFDFLVGNERPRLVPVREEGDDVMVSDALEEKVPIAGWKRIRMEFYELIQLGFLIGRNVLDKTGLRWVIYVPKPENCDFTGIFFLIEVWFSADHPFKRVFLRFLSPFTHPLIMKDGFIKLELLEPDNWSPKLTLAVLMESIVKDILLSKDLSLS